MMINIPESFYKTGPNLVANLAMVCEVTLKDKEAKEVNISYELQRCITDDDNWEFYTSLGCDETTAIEQWHYWQERQPKSKFRMYKVTKELVAMSGNGEKDES